MVNIAYVIAVALVIVSITFYFFNLTNNGIFVFKVKNVNETSEATIRQTIDADQAGTGMPKKLGTIEIRPGKVSEADITVSNSK